MITRETIKEIIERYLFRELTVDQISDWAYEMITEGVPTDDELVTEILYNLVSFQDVGFIFDQYRPIKEKLEYFVHWLDGDQDCDWEQYTSIFDPGKLC